MVNAKMAVQRKGWGTVKEIGGRQVRGGSKIGLHTKLPTAASPGLAPPWVSCPRCHRLPPVYVALKLARTTRYL